MKLWDLIKVIKFKKIYKKDKKIFFIFHNDIEIEKIKIISYSTHHDVYRRLRFFSTPIFNKGYLLRKKRGFNTMLFNQNYDIVITNKNNVIISTIKNCPRGFISPKYSNSFNIIFFRVGTINHYNFKIKDTLRLGHEIIQILRKI